MLQTDLFEPDPAAALAPPRLTPRQRKDLERKERLAKRAAYQAEMRALHEENWPKIQAVIAGGRDALLALHAAASQHFSAEAVGKTYERKPALSVAIPAAGSPPGRLSIAPVWRPRDKTLDTARVGCEFMIDRVAVFGVGQRSCELKVEVGADGVRLSTCTLVWGVETAERFVAEVRAFLADPSAAFSRASDNCCLCGRGLTDATSRSRGVGPECMRRADEFRRFVELHVARNPQLDHAPALETLR